MKIIPKFAGGGISSLFTVYQPIPYPQISSQGRSVKDQMDSVTVKDSSKQSKSEEEKGKLTEKDLFNMIKDIDGLPNEMKIIIKNLQNTLDTQNLLDISTNELTNNYLNVLYKLKVANQNKTKFDESVKVAKENGSLGEVAITLSGNLMATDKNGGIKEITLEQYQQDPEQYSLLTNSNLAWLRKYSPMAAFSQSDDSFEIISNGVGFESFQKLLDTAKTKLGNYTYSEQGIAGKEALTGLRIFQNASKEEQEKYIKEALDGRYGFTNEISTNANNIKAYLNYLVAVLPKRMKVWASLKTGIADENQAALALAGQYLQGNLTENIKYHIDFKGTDAKLKHASGDGSSGEPKKGFWQQVQTDQGGDIQNFNLLVGKGSMSVTGKFYGTTPGMEENTSLSKYISNSKVGFIIKNTKNITFGDQTLSTDGFDDVMVNANGGAMVATLPINPNGKVNFEILDTYVTIENKLKEHGYKPGTQEYETTKAYVLKEKGLGYLVDAQSGRVNPKYFGHFLILEGVASSKTKVIGKNNEVAGLVGDDYMENASGDTALYDTVKRALSDKEKGEYTLDNNWISFNNDKLYKGNIFIPINQNNINGANADKNDLKVSQAEEYEYDMQRQEERQNNWEKSQRKQPTNSDVLF